MPYNKKMALKKDKSDTTKTSNNEEYALQCYSHIGDSLNSLNIITNHYRQIPFKSLGYSPNF